MNAICPFCGLAFEILKEDLAFYAKISPVIAGKRYDIPPPTLCPACRMQRRISFRNFFNLYHTTSALSGKSILSMYHTDAPFPVYEIHEWWGDAWDPLQYGITPDFRQPVFEQIRKIHNSVPRMNMYNIRCENTDYCNFSFQSRNCFLIGGNVDNEDCCYGNIVWQSRNCFDNLYIYRCELCYECVDCFQCFNVAFCRACENCSDSRFLVHCSGCKNCFGCVGLKNAENHLFNQKLTEQEYRNRMKEFNSGSYRMIGIAQENVQKLIGKEIVKHYHGINCENVSGDYLYNCKNVHQSFDTKNCEDCSFLGTTESLLHCYDCNYSPNRIEWSTECLTCTGNSYIGCHNVHDSSDMYYCEFCSNCQHCFGCEGLRRKQHCIFNVQYAEKEYETILQKLISSMQNDGSWGEFFPVHFSPFGYNETMAQEYFPLREEEVIAKGWQWKDEEKKESQYLGPPYHIPDDITDVPDGICKQVLLCQTTKRPYTIAAQELRFLRKMHLPVPRKCFAERHRERMLQKNPRNLWKRKCMKCGKEMETAYSPERPEKVYCEECYLKSVY